MYTHIMRFKRTINTLTPILLVCILLYTRLANLSWGLPYPFHPDERNMADAIMRLGCSQSMPQYLQGLSIYDKFLLCFDPHFFAYGQITLYVAYLIAQFRLYLSGAAGGLLRFDDAIMSLRLISSFASVALYFVMQNIFHEIEPVYKKSRSRFIAHLLFICSPVLIQFAHFGTTESLLMLLYTLLIYIGILYSKKKLLPISYVLLSGVVTGIAVAVKVSSGLFVVFPFLMVLWSTRDRSSIVRMIIRRIGLVIMLGAVVAAMALAGSPFNLLNLNEFRGSMEYETGVARGIMKVFYTRQFEMTTPIVFQLRTVFPYVLGPVVFMLFGAGFILMSFRKKELNIMRLSFLIAFIPTAFLYAKWARFMAPAYPAAIILAAVYLTDQANHIIELVRRNIQNKTHVHPRRASSILLTLIALSLLIAFSIIPGIAYLTIYTTKDVRFVASEWIYKNMPENSLILSETANVVDMPIQPPQGFSAANIVPRSYRYISFNSYDLEVDRILQEQFMHYQASADYIFVPSRRVFMNHTCFNDAGVMSGLLLPSDELRCRELAVLYPRLNSYYRNLFTGDSGFTQVAEFTSYPRIEVFGAVIFEYPDEGAEETWTVFDHPVVRIYKRSGAIGG